MRCDESYFRVLQQAGTTLQVGFESLPEFEPSIDWPAVGKVVQDAARRLQNNYPYHHPLYVGQMLKPPHPVAQLAYALAMMLNPNNHALDGGRESSAMEREAVAELAAMFGYESHIGHLCSGGTVANMEALWVARELRPGTTVAASSQAHYTHARISSILAQPFESIPVDARGRMDVAALEEKLATGNIGTVVATLGTTATGAIDPLDEIVRLRQSHDFRLHVDAAYGGYYTLASNLAEPARRAFAAVPRADSIVVDPHKHGLQPYGCGCVLFRDPNIARVYAHDSPYTYFTTDELHLGEISLECSRPGAAAVALWATQKLLPPKTDGEFAQMLDSCREAALDFHQWVEAHPRFVPLFEPELDIVVWAVAARSATESSRLAREVFNAAAERDLHLALAKLPQNMLVPAQPVDQWDSDEITCLRACAMKPEHREWLPEICDRLDAAAAEIE